MSENDKHCGNCDWHIVKSQNERLCRLDGKVHPRGYYCKHWRTFNYHNRVDKQRQADDYMRRVQDKEIAEKKLEVDKKVREEEKRFQRLMAWVDQARKAVVEIIGKIIHLGGGG